MMIHAKTLWVVPRERPTPQHRDHPSTRRVLSVTAQRWCVLNGQRQHEGEVHWSTDNTPLPRGGQVTCA